MPVEPQTRRLLDVLAALRLPELHTLTPEQARAHSAERRATMPPGPPAIVSDHVVPGPAGPLALRLYRPGSAGAAGEGATLPVLVWFHGGGFVVGSVAESDPECRELAVRAGIAVASVEYRLAPEHPFPAAPEDCFAATRWVVAEAASLGVDPARVAVGGDSAGGNLAAVVALLARERGGPALCLQLLVYPVTDSYRMETPSHHANAEGYFLTRAGMEWFREHYCADPEARADGLVSPLRHRDLAGLPPARVLTAEYDPLRDEGEAYAARLEQAGVPVTLTRYDGTIHGFFSMAPILDVGGRALDEAAAALRAALG